MQHCGDDFGPASRFSLPEPPGPADLDEDGRYHAFRTDEWGTGWEYRLFGVWGHRIHFPLGDLNALATYKPPAPPLMEGPAWETEREAARRHREQYFLAMHAGLLFERMQSLRPFEDVLVEVTLDAPEINRIADLIMENMAGHIRKALSLDADAVCFGDDFGTQSNLLISPAVWRRFFKPRYRQLFEPVRQAGKHIFFHSCGQIADLLPDLADLGVTAIWPQLPAFDLQVLARRCRDLRLAVQLHPDRGDLMQRGTPDQVRRYIYTLCETFSAYNGGCWLYIEIDPGFPFENVQALFETAMELHHT
jgi:hypothetical protein